MSKVCAIVAMVVGLILWLILPGCVTTTSVRMHDGTTNSSVGFEQTMDTRGARDAGDMRSQD